MSYDICIRIPEHDERCPHCNEVIRRVPEEEFAYWDPTHNYGPMFRAACETERGIHDWDGKTVAEVEPLLAAMVGRLSADPAKFKKHDASNGWGTYKDLLPFLVETVLPRFRQAPPFAVVSVR